MLFGKRGGVAVQLCTFDVPAERGFQARRRMWCLETEFMPA
jgi:hypothetical protein